MPTSYTVTTVTPGAGDQTVGIIHDHLFVGSSGSFDYVVLCYTGTVWRFVIYENDDPNSPFYPSKTSEQLSPGTDPLGGYGLVVNGVPDTDAGVGSVGP